VPVDREALIDSLADSYGLPRPDLDAAVALLNLPAEGFAVRITQTASFASTFGVSIKALAELVAQTGSRIEPWDPTDRHSREDWARIHEVMDGGDWAGAILRLLDERTQSNAAPPD
jgi:hypothetical protein